jgi:hypothetical protein
LPFWLAVDHECSLFGSGEPLENFFPIQTRRLGERGQHCSASKKRAAQS